MRKHQQKQILGLLKTIEEAQTDGFYADCQEGALSIGEFIESVEGEGTQTVALLEEYCVLLYQANEVVSEIDSSQTIVKKLRKQLIKIETSVKNELKPKKIEVVFLPYKASMWDTMESVWQSANDDPDCNAIVVPIPYYDKLPGDKLGQMHYEGYLYPKGTPIVDWQSYNLEEHHPDVIFIHNPYDDRNYITSVEPRFYSSKLKNYTDLLVYIPYFISNGITVGEHHCQTSAVYHADLVIVQSDAIKEEYAKYTDANKVIALGSPKLDAVVNAKRESFRFPDQWKKLIQKNDDTEKKVVLYNTTVGTILTGGAQFLAKLRSVLNTFSKRDDVVLLWRPHPLSEVTYESMRSEMAEEYNRLVNEYTQQGWGIYDDTPDLHRAIAISDIYYGTGGSLFPLYTSTGKPVLIQNINITDDGESMQNDIMLDDGENYWITLSSLYTLLRINKISNQIEYIGRFPKVKMDSQWLYNEFHISGSSIQNIQSITGVYSPYQFFTKDISRINDIHGCCFYEFNLAGLSLFLDYFCSEEYTDNKAKLREKQIEIVRKINRNADGTCGAKIFEHIKSEVLR